MFARENKMLKFSNKELTQLTGMSNRQIIYLAERKIVAPEIKEASGRGTTRLYSKRDAMKLLVAQALRKSGMDFPSLGIVASVVGSFCAELEGLLGEEMADSPSILHLVDGRIGFLSFKSGKSTSKVFEVTAQGKAKFFQKSPTEVLAAGTVHLSVDLEKVFAPLKAK
jgi:hypothetical protein